MNFNWLPGKVGVPVIVPAPTPDAPPIVGVVVPPATDIALRTAHSTWQGGLAATIVGTVLPSVGVAPKGATDKILIALFTGLLAFIRSWLAHRKAAKMPKVPPA